MVRPDPFPNSAVKHSLADGSSPIGSARVGSRQPFKKTGDHFSGFFICTNRRDAFDQGCELAQQILKFDASAATHATLAKAADRAGNAELAQYVKQK